MLVEQMCIFTKLHLIVDNLLLWGAFSWFPGCCWFFESFGRETDRKHLKNSTPLDIKLFLLSSGSISWCLRLVRPSSFVVPPPFFVSLEEGGSVSVAEPQRANGEDASIFQIRQVKSNLWRITAYNHTACVFSITPLGCSFFFSNLQKQSFRNVVMQLLLLVFRYGVSCLLATFPFWPHLRAACYVNVRPCAIPL